MQKGCNLISSKAKLVYKIFNVLVINKYKISTAVEFTSRH